MNIEKNPMATQLYITMGVTANCTRSLPVLKIEYVNSMNLYVKPAPATMITTHWNTTSGRLRRLGVYCIRCGSSGCVTEDCWAVVSIMVVSSEDYCPTPARF